MMNNNALEALRAGIKAISDSQSFQEYLKSAARFHNYSLYNRLLIWSQRRDATLVAGFNAWKDQGRYVKKGEKGIAILAPMFVKKTDSLTGEKKESLVGFRSVYVFDVKQTDGKPLPEIPMPKELTGEQGGELLGAMVDFAQHGGLTVLPSFREFPDERNGDYSPADKQIRLRAELSTVQKAKTMAHECAHWILHTSPEGSRLSREAKETEAEAAAFLALAAFGIPTDQYSFAYIAGWSAGDMNLLEKSLGRIQRAAEEIGHAIRSRLEEAAGK
jgi:antirestriction protein ArdC